MLKHFSYSDINQPKHIIDTCAWIDLYQKLIYIKRLCRANVHDTSI